MLEIIGVGFGRTGTLSLKLALEHLGYGKCYHFSEILKRAQARQWLRVISEPTQDWENLFSGYQSTTDWPGATYYRELAEVYPDARFILTVRDADDWYTSVESTIYPLRRIMPAWLPGIRSVALLADHVIWNGTFNGQFAQRDIAIACYNDHIDSVQRFIPPEKLLLFDVRDGWAPLCSFVHRPVPTITFPNVNEKARMHRYISLLKMFRFAAIAILALIAAALIHRVFLK